MFFSSPRIKKHFPHVHSEKGRAGILYNAGEVLSLETMIIMSLMTERMRRMSRTPFPRSLSAEIAIT